MPEEVRRLADLEAGLDDRQLSQVRFGRSRFLRTASLALFGLATGLVAVSREAGAAPTPRLCHGAPGCEACDGSECITPGCTPINTCGGNHCWRVKTRKSSSKKKICYNHYTCCDWTDAVHEQCICRSYLGWRCKRRKRR